jgi:putative membrane protein
MFIHPDAWWAGPLHLLPLLLLAVLIGVLVWGVLRLTAERSPMLARVGAPDRPQGPPPRDQALEELRVRYARGEVDRADYLARSTDLGGMRVPEMPTDGPEERPGDQATDQE